MIEGEWVQCKTCQGRGFVSRSTGIHLCEVCLGAGGGPYFPSVIRQILYDSNTKEIKEDEALTRRQNRKT